MERKTEKEIKNGEMKKKKSEATPPPAPRRRFHYASLTSQRRQIQIKNKESESLPMFPLDGTTSAAPPPQHSPWLRLQHESSQFLLPLRCLRGGGACEDACEDAWDCSDAWGHGNVMNGTRSGRFDDQMKHFIWRNQSQRRTLSIRNIYIKKSPWLHCAN